jgi:hypothetical protein
MWKSQHLNCGEYKALYDATAPAILQGGESFALYTVGTSLQDTFPQIESYRSMSQSGGAIYDATLPAIIQDHDDPLMGEFVTHGFVRRQTGPMLVAFRD